MNRIKFKRTDFQCRHLFIFPFPSRKMGMWFSISLPVPRRQKALPAHPWDEEDGGGGVRVMGVCKVFLCWRWTKRQPVIGPNPSRNCIKGELGNERDKYFNIPLFLMFKETFVFWEHHWTKNFSACAKPGLQTKQPSTTVAQGHLEDQQHISGMTNDNTSVKMHNRYFTDVSKSTYLKIPTNRFHTDHNSSQLYRDIAGKSQMVLLWRRWVWKGVVWRFGVLWRGSTQSCLWKWGWG